MAKRKPAKNGTPAVTARDLKGAVPCLVIVIGVIVLMGLLFAAMLKSSR